MDRRNRLYGLDQGQRAAVLISECQTAIIGRGVAIFPELAEAVHARDIVARINGLSANCREKNIPIIHCIIRIGEQDGDFPVVSSLQLIMWRNKLLRLDCSASWIDPGIDLGAADIVSDRRQGITGFHASDLERILRHLSIETLILTGVSTNIALVGMSIEAVNRGFRVVIPEDCTAGATPETHDHAVKYTLPILASLTDSAAVIGQLNRRQP